MVGAGINTRDYAERVPLLVAAGADVLCIDSTEGYSEWQTRTNEWIRENYGDSVICSEGGIVDAYRMTLAPAMGADFLMLGRYVALFDESPTSRVNVNGQYMKEYEWIRENYGDSVKVGAGNVVDADGFRFLADCGADFIKVGIGGGSICITRETKGIGRGQATALIDVCRLRCRLHQGRYRRRLHLHHP